MTFRVWVEGTLIFMAGAALGMLIPVRVDRVDVVRGLSLALLLLVIRGIVGGVWSKEYLVPNGKRRLNILVVIGVVLALVPFILRAIAK